MNSLNLSARWRSWIVRAKDEAHGGASGACAADEAEVAAVVEEAEAAVAESSASPVASTPPSLTVFAVPHSTRNASEASFAEASFADSLSADDDSEDSLAAMTPIARVALAGGAVPSPIR